MECSGGWVLGKIKWLYHVALVTRPVASPRALTLDLLRVPPLLKVIVLQI